MATVEITITPDPVYRAAPLSLTWGSNQAWRYVQGSIIVRIDGVYGSGIGLDMDIRPDGSLCLRSVGPSRGAHGGNCYAHVVADAGAITEEQRITIARAYLGIDRPYGMTPGKTLIAAAFDGMSPDAISKKYGDGRPVLLA